MNHKVEIFTNNEWHIFSWHRNLENAIINAEVISKSRKCPARIVYGGKIVWESNEILNT